jgi:Family of unknown function (DUF5924)
LSEMGREQIDRVGRLLVRHQAIFWTLHSIWALGWGIGFMVAGSKRAWLLRYGLASVGLVWATSLLLPVLLRGSLISEERKGIARRLVLWAQKWQLQGLAFFILPLYHRSATYPSRNTLFMILLVVAALAATIDVVYDEYVTRKTWLLGAFLAFTAFACVNLTLPMIWHVGGLWNLAAGALLATSVFVSFWVRHTNEKGRGLWQVVAVGFLFLLVVTVWRPLVPPAPLRLVSTSFGMSQSEDRLEVSPAVTSLPPAREARVYVVAAIQAPAGLAEGVRHVWSLDGKRVSESRLIDVTGGRAQGFRSRSSAMLRGLARGQRVRVEVETAWGQLIGRSEIEVR